MAQHSKTGASKKPQVGDMVECRWGNGCRWELSEVISTQYPDHNGQNWFNVVSGYLRPEWENGDGITWRWPAGSPHADEIITNEQGGKQSDVAYAFDAMPPKAILKVAEILKAGRERYGKNNWKKIPISDHVNHSVGHQFKHLIGDKTEEHLANAATRALFALELYLESKK